MKHFHKTYLKIFGKTKKGGNIKDAQKRRSYKKISRFGTVATKQSKDEKISWKGLEEKTYNDLGLDGNAFKPEDLFHDNAEDDALYL